jgi:general secretion pathway protein E
MRHSLPYSFAVQHGVLYEQDCLLHRPGLGLQTLLELRRYLGHGWHLQEIPEQEFQQRLTAAYQGGNSAAQQAVAAVDESIDLRALMDDLPRDSDLLSEADNAPVIRLINAILGQAVREKASDIHIEPFEDRLVVRFRVDGMLNEVLSPKPALAPVLASRLKVMARLDIAEKRLPQDGRISVRLGGHAVDIRISTIPSAHGERVVLRLLDQAAGRLGLPELAMPADVAAGFTRALQRPHGILLVTGPTGSGKTTTLYAGLNSINDRRRNILTIEDPVEYLLPGIGQTQVNSKVGMSFAKGLRAILRQDPDVVMVGEIRDAETAAIAVQASLTGHLVLSTLHTNTAIGAVTRLKDMGVESFLLASSLEAVMAQRLVRLLCPHCKAPCQPTPLEQERHALTPGDLLHRARGCEHCHQSGYKGRTAIYELIEIDAELRQLIHEEAGEQVLLQHARRSSRGIEENGMQRVLAGDTSLEEVLRVMRM